MNTALKTVLMVGALAVGGLSAADAQSASPVTPFWSQDAYPVATRGGHKSETSSRGYYDVYEGRSAGANMSEQPAGGHNWSPTAQPWTSGL